MLLARQVPQLVCPSHPICLIRQGISEWLENGVACCATVAVDGESEFGYRNFGI